ncbi:hypothetical protein LguiB_000624 [Lonicera macranthoides]
MEGDPFLATTAFYYPVNPDPGSIPGEIWGLAEQTAVNIITCVHPTMDSMEKRTDVIEHLRRLIVCSIRCEVFPYGSVPLKTYLPDGDIDLTVISNLCDDQTLARHVLVVLQKEELNKTAVYEVKNIQFVEAEVKLVKCLVDDIVVDITFNQFGGLCALCFLEQIDRVVVKDHLLKRSIILIKAWCYFESRILGSLHGLISTYALEMLVLHIFHMFNSSLNGPFEVLYRFLDYFSKFDWEKYCISLHGPALKSSLPNIVVEKPENGGNDLMLREEFLSTCVEIFSVPSKGPETNLPAFCLKDLNIIDPLKESNNLGRSVSKCNFSRICCAFKFGARKLGRILQLPRESIGVEIKKIFRNTLQKHEPKHESFPIFRVEHFNLLSISTNTVISPEDKLFLKHANDHFDEDMEEFRDLYIWEQRLQETTNNIPNSSSPSNRNSNNVLWGQYGNLEIRKLKKGNFENGRHRNGTICRDSVLDGSGSSSFSELGNNCIVTSNIRETSCLNYNEETECLNPLLDLSGDFDSHLRNLLHARFTHGYALCPRVTCSQPTPPPNWGSVRQIKSNGTCNGPRASVARSSSSPVAFDSERRSKLCIERSSSSSAAYHSEERPKMYVARSSVSSVAFHSEERPKIYVERSSTSSVDFDLEERPKMYMAGSSQSTVAFGSLERPKTRGTGTFIPNPRPLIQGRPEVASGNCNVWRYTPRITGLELQASKPVMGKKDGNSENVLHLKNEDEFPPLSA